MAREIEYSEDTSRTVPDRSSVHGVWFVGLGFLLFGIAHALGRWKGHTPYPFLTSDPANICTWSVAWALPENFVLDPLLSRLSTVDFYFTVHRPLLNAFMAGGFDCGTVTTFLGVFHIFFQGMGFFFLGRRLFGDYMLAASLAFISCSYITINIGEFWGIALDPMPRETFQAALPWLLLLVLEAKRKEWLRPWVPVAGSGLIYVHPVSLPPWLASIGLVLLAWTVRGAQPLKGALALVAGAFGGMLVIAPFAWVYATRHFYGTPPSADFQSIVADTVGREYFDISRILIQFIDRTEVQLWLIMGLLGMALWIRSGRGAAGSENGTDAATTAGLFACTVCIAVLVSFATRAFARATGQYPVELDLIRAIRYTIPLLQILLLMGVTSIAAAVRERDARFESVLKSVFLVLAITIGVSMSSWNSLRAWSDGRMVPSASPRVHALFELYRAVARETKPTEAIYARYPLDPLAIRYAVRRAVVYASKDGGTMSYGNPEGVFEWENRRRAEAEIGDGCAEISGSLAFAKRYGATWVAMVVPPESLACIETGTPAFDIEIDEAHHGVLLRADPARS